MHFGRRGGPLNILVTNDGGHAAPGQHSGEPLLPSGIGLNINYPAVPNPGPPVLTELSRGYSTVTLGLKPDIDFAVTGNIVLDVRIWPAPSNPERKNDAEMFAAGYMTVTPIHGNWTGSAASIHSVLQRLR